MTIFKVENLNPAARELLGARWAMPQGEVEQLVSRVLQESFSADDRAAAAELFAEEANQPPYQMAGDGIAVIAVTGVLTKRYNLYTWWFGGTAMEHLAARLKAAENDPAVVAVVLDVDSPGGTVDGTKELADKIAAFNKPVVAFANGLAASAAYWCACRADEIMASSLAEVGSIGVVLRHVEYADALKDAGIKVSYITAGKYKRLANEAEPLSDEGRDYLQAILDHIYSVFVDDVASGRKVSVETVVKMAEGRIFIGQKALDAGLIDSLGTLEQAIARAGVLAVDGGESGRDKSGKDKSSETFSEAGESDMEIKDLTVEMLAAERGDLVETLEKQGAAAERVRIAEIKEAAFPGQEALAAELINDNIAADEARRRLMAAEKKSRAATAQAEVDEDKETFGELGPDGEAAAGGGGESQSKKEDALAAKMAAKGRKLMGVKE